ncbi:MAG TPA: VPLPA-CTERM sorting domain-containing protein [Syntrophales bacterium]|jgi:hypothetical protein|nr:VPLPA-CTERM sorting domain-containing protein [Syntrophales bacterium]HPI57157.1 VPLPA-CTERM sorting domain-containing protein [Syntrophales bacterium]HPN24756.1 VPLPA-CTERM sorting domain-containing protein [Syntrophales bacterium]HQM30824.1 VPLPA-CTERM sorting domain-containing protein [Syntrophales bacterium]
MNKGGRVKQVVLLAILIAAIFSVSPAHSELIYSSLGPGDSFTTTSALVVGTYEEGPPPLTLVATQWGFSFTPSIDATLDSIKFAAVYNNGINGLNVILMSDSAGVPGTALEAFNFTDLFPTGTLYTATSLLHPVMNQATKYWVVLAPQDNGTFGWYEDDSKTGPLAARRDLLASNPDWYAVGALHPAYFAVEGTEGSVVPIPGAAWFLGSGLVGLVAIRRRFRK